MSTIKKTPSPFLVILAFAAVYLVWGSTYFFIQKAVHEIPPFILGALRFFAAAVLMLVWCLIKSEKILDRSMLKTAAITGVLLLFVGNGAVIWSEQFLPSSLVAVLVSSAPLWFVLLDKPKWKQNLSNRKIILGLVIGFIGVVLLFSEQTGKALAEKGSLGQVVGLIILLIGTISWAGGSLYSKYKSTGSPMVNTTWQMLAGGTAFLLTSLTGKEWRMVNWAAVSNAAWLSVAYLVLMGSLAAYSAYVWLLGVRPATQVSTYAYVNPVVAVLLGVLFAGEHMSILQLAGLAVILLSVLLINRSKDKKE